MKRYNMKEEYTDFKNRDWTKIVDTDLTHHDDREPRTFTPTINIEKKEDCILLYYYASHYHEIAEVFWKKEDVDSFINQLWQMRCEVFDNS